MAFLLTFLKQQYGSLPSVDSFKSDLSGRTVIVVGSNAGLGLEAARHLATMMGGAQDGGRLILACRNVQKGGEALTSIQSSTGFTRIEVWEVDLASFSSIRAFADRFENEGGGRLDLLVMNSGITTGEFSQTADGWESQLQVNYIGTAYLALRLVPSLSKVERVPPCPRLVVVSSDMHYVAKIPQNILSNGNILEQLNDKGLSKSAMRSRYAVTKLLSIMFVRALAARLPTSSPIEVDAANPGLCKSSLRAGLKTDRVVHVFASILAFLFARTTEEGGRSIAYAAVARPSEDEKPFHGKFVSACEVLPVSAFALSEVGKKAEDQVWTELIDVLTRVDEKIPNIVSVYLK